MLRALLRLAALLLGATIVVACNSEQQAKSPPTLLDAAEQGDLQVMGDFLKGSQLVNMRDACLWTPLMKAALNGHYTAVERLIDSGADIDLVDKGGYSAMMLAASNNFHQVVDLLLKHRADVDLVEHTHGWTALIWAAKRGHSETVRVLLEHGAQRSLIDDEGKSALDHASEHQFGEIIALLKPANSATTG